jgi:hypothetical protein
MWRRLIADDAADAETERGQGKTIVLLFAALKSFAPRKQKPKQLQCPRFGPRVPRSPR